MTACLTCGACPCYEHERKTVMTTDPKPSVTDEKPTEFWSEEGVYDEQISPLMTRIIAICKEHQIPMVAQFQYANEKENGPAFCTTALPLPRACEKMRRLRAAVQPERPVVLAETCVTNPDGSEHITIRRVQ